MTDDDRKQRRPRLDQIFCAHRSMFVTDMHNNRRRHRATKSVHKLCSFAEKGAGSGDLLMLTIFTLSSDGLIHKT